MRFRILIASAVALSFSICTAAFAQTSPNLSTLPAFSPTLNVNDCIGGLRRAAASDAVVQNKQIAIGTCYDPNSVGINQTTEQAKTYLNSLPKKPLSSCAPPTQQNIEKLNDTFARCAAQFFKAYTAQYGAVNITSAFRDNTPGSGPNGSKSANECAGGAPNSNHAKGIAMDVTPAQSDLASYQKLWKFASQNPKFGVCFPFQDHPLSGYPNGDKPHMILAGTGGNEAALCAAQGVTKPCDGLPFTPTTVSGQSPSPYTPNPQTGYLQNPQTMTPQELQSQTQTPQQLQPQTQTPQQQLPSTANPLNYTNTTPVTPIDLNQLATSTPSTALQNLLNALNTPTTTTPTSNIATSSSSTTSPLLWLQDINTTNTITATSTASTTSFTTTNFTTNPQPTTTPSTTPTNSYYGPSAQQTFTSQDLQDTPGPSTPAAPSKQPSLVAQLLQKIKDVVLKILSFFAPYKAKPAAAPLPLNSVRATL